MLENLNSQILVCAKNNDQARLMTLLDVAKRQNVTDININEALSWAAHNGHPVIIEICLNHGAAIDYKDSQGNTPLHWAAYNGHATTVQFLIQKGANERMLNHNFLTPAKLAQSQANYNPQSAIVSKLIEEMGNEIMQLKTRIVDLEKTLAMRTSYSDSHQSSHHNTPAESITRFGMMKSC